MANHYTNHSPAELIPVLHKILADTSVVYYKTHAFHWNVEGSDFYPLHLMFEKFYVTLWESLDEIAERIRALNGKAPPSLIMLLENASIKEMETTPTAPVMVQTLKDDYLLLAQKTKNAALLAEEKKDPITSNILTEQATFLEKAAWMLFSSSIA